MDQLTVHLTLVHLAFSLVAIIAGTWVAVRTAARRAVGKVVEGYIQALEERMAKRDDEEHRRIREDVRAEIEVERIRRHANHTEVMKAIGDVHSRVDDLFKLIAARGPS